MQPPYVEVEWGGDGPVKPWCILCVNEDCTAIRLPFTLFSILSSLILWKILHYCLSTVIISVAASGRSSRSEHRFVSWKKSSLLYLGKILDYFFTDMMISVAASGCSARSENRTRRFFMSKEKILKEVLECRLLFQRKIILFFAPTASFLREAYNKIKTWAIYFFRPASISPLIR